MTRVRRLIGLAALFGITGASAVAQTPIRPPQAPNMPPTNQVIPEKIKPEGPSTTGTVGSGATLSDKLEATDGVIRPPANVDPEITAPAPVPNPGTTRIIPPPGSPGGDQSVVPK
jgi:hypothetical protein